MTQQQEEKLIADTGEIKGILGNGNGVLAMVRQNHQDNRENAKGIQEIKEMLPKVVSRHDVEKWVIRLLIFSQSVIILLFGTGILKV